MSERLKATRPAAHRMARFPDPDKTLSPERMRTLLQPFLAEPPSDELLAALSAYLELLLRWNARLNLTAVREAESIVTRHMGECLFAAAQLLPERRAALRAIDIGSGAGFPGLPMKIYAPNLRITLIEAQQKKATFLKEAIRTLHLGDAAVFADRAEKYNEPGELVMLRAVEHFEQVLPVAASVVGRVIERSANVEFGVGSSRPRLALLVGSNQVTVAQDILPGFQWQKAIPTPQSNNRVLLVGSPG